MSQRTASVPRVLDVLGLGEVEERVYRQLVRRGGATLAEIADSASVSQPRAREALGSLAEMGLLTRSAKRPNRYTPTPPQSAIELLVRSREEQFDQVRLAAKQFDEELRAIKPGVAKTELVEVLAPGEGLFNLSKTLVGSASKEILGLQNPPLSVPDENFITFKLAILSRGVSCRSLFSVEALGLSGVMDLLEVVTGHGEQARVVPRLPTHAWIIDREVALLPLHADRPGLSNEYLLVHRCALLDCLVTMFEAMWAQGYSLHFGAETTVTDETGPLSGADRQLLTLLAAGLKDEAIAKRLGMGLRTIERRMRQIMDVLGTTTRFQTAVEATTRGWVGRSDEQPAWPSENGAAVSHRR